MKTNYNKTLIVFFCKILSTNRTMDGQLLENIRNDCYEQGLTDDQIRLLRSYFEAQTFSVSIPGWSEDYSKMTTEFRIAYIRRIYMWILHEQAVDQFYEDILGTYGPDFRIS